MLIFQTCNFGYKVRNTKIDKKKIRRSILDKSNVK